ncbi:MAG TPA: phosphotransferase, partial [Croceibacterium sp.]
MSRTALSNGHVLLPDHRSREDGGYIIQRKIEAGGFGITYAGIKASGAGGDAARLWLEPYQPVAIKEFYPDELAERDGSEVIPLAENESAEEIFQQSFDRFLREAERLYFLTCIRALRAAMAARPGSDDEATVQNDIKAALGEGMDRSFTRSTRPAMNLVSRLEGKLAEAARKAISNAPLPIVYDFFLAGGTAYYVMEFLEGRTLKDRLARQRREGDNRRETHHGVRYDLLSPMPLDRLRHFIGKSLDALEELHCGIPGQQLVHCDLKPGNIMFRSMDSDDPVLIDFGMARNTISDKSLAMLGGTVGFAPFELDPLGLAQAGPGSGSQRGAARIGPYTDIYSLAVILRLLASGVEGRAFPSAYHRRTEVRAGQPDPATLLPPIAPSVPDRMVRAIEHGLAIDATKRPASISAWRSAFGFDQPGERTTGTGGSKRKEWRPGHGDEGEDVVPPPDEPIAGDEETKQFVPVEQHPQVETRPRKASANQMLAAGLAALTLAAIGIGAYLVTSGDEEEVVAEPETTGETEVMAQNTPAPAPEAGLAAPTPELAPAAGPAANLPAPGPTQEVAAAAPPIVQPPLPRPPAEQPRSVRFGVLGITVQTVTNEAQLANLRLSDSPPNDPVRVIEVFKADSGFRINSVYV